MNLGTETRNTSSGGISPQQRRNPLASRQAADGQEGADSPAFGLFVCRCPTTQRIISSGIEMDQQTFQRIGNFGVRVHCRACQTVHVLGIASGALVPDDPDRERSE